MTETGIKPDRARQIVDLRAAANTECLSLAYAVGRYLIEGKIVRLHYVGDRTGGLVNRSVAKARAYLYERSLRLGMAVMSEEKPDPQDGGRFMTEMCVVLTTTPVEVGE